MLQLQQATVVTSCQLKIGGGGGGGGYIIDSLKKI